MSGGLNCAADILTGVGAMVGDGVVVVLVDLVSSLVVTGGVGASGDVGSLPGVPTEGSAGEFDGVSLS